MRYVLILAGLALLLSLMTGLTQVQPGERAVVRRFGRVLDFRPEPGLYVGLPWGIDRVDRVAVERLRSVPVGYQKRDDEDASGGTPEGQLLTGDHNLVNVQATVNYAVDPEQVLAFVLQTDRADELVARAAETALAEWVAGRTVDDVLLRGKTELPAWLVERTQRRVDEYQIGVQVRTAAVNHLNPPAEVSGAFEDVTKAQNAISTTVNQASQDADRRLREAESERFKTVRMAEAYAVNQSLQAQADVLNFEKRLEQYRQLTAKDPNYLNALWWDEMSRLYARLRQNGRIDLLDHRLSGDGLDITQFPAMPKK
jgi:modulator of FtsH protease HflK